MDADSVRKLLYFVPTPKCRSTKVKLKWIPPDSKHELADIVLAAVEEVRFLRHHGNLRSNSNYVNAQYQLRSLNECVKKMKVSVASHEDLVNILTGGACDHHKSEDGFCIYASKPSSNDTNLIAYKEFRCAYSGNRGQCQMKGKMGFTLEDIMAVLENDKDSVQFHALCICSSNCVHKVDTSSEQRLQGFKRKQTIDKHFYDGVELSDKMAEKVYRAENEATNPTGPGVVKSITQVYKMKNEE